MQTLDVKYADRIHGFQGRLLKVVTKAQLKVVFGHFHLIKAMIEKMDHVRRREMAKLDCEAKRTIKGHRFVFMRNEENLDAKGRRILGELRASNLQLADAHMLKEQLRRAYTFCETRHDAKSALRVSI